jgi:flagellar biogenesis protein FliO
MEQQELLSMAFKMTISLGVVLLAFAGTIFFVKKFANQPFKMFQKGTKEKNLKPLEVLAFQSLGPGKGIYLIRCIDKKIIVGATNASIQHLGDLIEDEDLDGLEDKTRAPTFQTSLKNSHLDTQTSPHFEKGLKEIARV